MKLRSILSVLLVTGMFSPALFAANFQCGFLIKRGTETTLSIPRPPDVMISDRFIRVEVVETPKTIDGDTKNSIREAVERALAPDLIVNENPEVIFRIYVDDYNPVIKRSKTIEERRVVTGKNCTADERCTDKYEQKKVPVEYWEADVQMKWRVEVAHSSGKLIDHLFKPGDSYVQKKELSVNGVSSLDKNNTGNFGINVISTLLGGGASKSDSAALPDEQEIRGRLIDNIAGKFSSRYRKTYESRAVVLACDDELSEGNELVKNSNNNSTKDWNGALKLWEAAEMKKKETEGDRLYNMAVAYEALAFAAFDKSGLPEDADPQFGKALELYQQAMVLDPEEEYIRNAASRIQTSRNYLRGFKIQQGRMEAETEARFQEEVEQFEREEARRQAMMRIEDEDNVDERAFRTFVSALLENPEDPDETEMVSEARELYSLNEEQALRVFDQESVRKENIKKYQRHFEVFAKDKIIAKAERESLNTIARNLSLTADDIKAAESTYKFNDEK